MIRVTSLLSFLILATTACGGDDQHLQHEDDSDASPSVTFDGGAAQKSVVQVSCAGATLAATVTTPGLFFEPMSSPIKRGEIVKFDPSAGHDVDSKQSGLFTVSLGGEGCFRFDEVGSFGFRCRPHGFEGTIVVE